MSLTIGNALKEARSKKAITLEDVHSKIKIHPRVLQILEEGKFEKLPGPVYVKSFLKAYAEFLEINGEDLVRSYEKEGVAAPAQTIYLQNTDQKDKEASAITFSKILPALSTFLVVAALAASIYYVIDVSSRKNQSTVTGAKPVAVAASSKKTVKAPAPTKSNMLRSPDQENFPRISEEMPIELKVKASDNVWLHVTCDGKVLFQSTLKRGAREVWVAQKSIELRTGNASLMTLSVNNTSLGSPGKGSAKKLLITRDGVQKLQ